MINIETDFMVLKYMASLYYLDHIFFLNIVEIKKPGSKYWLKFGNHYV